MRAWVTASNLVDRLAHGDLVGRTSGCCKMLVAYAYRQVTISGNNNAFPLFKLVGSYDVRALRAPTNTKDLQVSTSDPEPCPTSGYIPKYILQSC
jgi:hypothetical protein